jgi:hypothetical protein
VNPARNAAQACASRNLVAKALQTLQRCRQKLQRSLVVSRVDVHGKTARLLLYQWACKSK